MKFFVLFLLFFVAGVLESKPLGMTNDLDIRNEIDYERAENKHTAKEKNRKIIGKTASAGTVNGSSTKRVVDGETTSRTTTKTTATTTTTTTSEQAGSNKPHQPETTGTENILSLLLPILHRWKFTPQTFLQDRVNALKQSLGNLGLVVQPSNATSPKQFATTNGILHLVGLNDSGFYTDRFEPAGFFGGNGWFANKGGILGGPGAILSTGSLLTDYPTPYKK